MRNTPPAQAAEIIEHAGDVGGYVPLAAILAGKLATRGIGVGVVMRYGSGTISGAAKNGAEKNAGRLGLRLLHRAGF